MAQADFELDDEAFIRHLVDTGGLSAAAARHPALLRTVLPLIRHDYRLYDAHRPLARAALEVPLTTFWGKTEMALGSVMPFWAECSRAFFPGKSYPGAHFYWQTSLGALTEDIAASALRYVSPSLSHFSGHA